MVVRFTWPKFGFGIPVGLPVPRHEPHLLFTVECSAFSVRPAPEDLFRKACRPWTT